MFPIFIGPVWRQAIDEFFAAFLVVVGVHLRAAGQADRQHAQDARLRPGAEDPDRHLAPRQEGLHEHGLLGRSPNRSEALRYYRMANVAGHKDAPAALKRLES